MKITLQLVIFFAALSLISNHGQAARQLLDSDQNQDDQMLFKYHGGQLLAGKLSINLIWYGKFKPSQRAIITDFITSSNPSVTTTKKTPTEPSVAQWWMSIQKYSERVTFLKKKPTNLTISLSKQTTDVYSLGKSLTMTHIQQLAAPSKTDGQGIQVVNVVLTSADVVVQGFCSNKCGTHGTVSSSASKAKGTQTPYIWVGNPETQCPGQCAWPFHQPMYGPQGPPLVSPNNDVGIDGLIVNLATLLAGTVTNPSKNGYFQGPSDAPLEAASACPGIYGNGAYPGYPGNLLVNPTTGASYNANGVNGRKYLLPALYDPAISKCSTLV